MAEGGQKKRSDTYQEQPNQVDMDGQKVAIDDLPVVPLQERGQGTLVVKSTNQI